MPFTPRNWTDDSAPAVSAANIEDLETRVTDYSDTRFGTDAGIHNIKDYGAVGDGVTDDTAAIQDALDAATGTGDTTHAGAIVWVPPGQYLHTGISPGGYTRIMGAGNAGDWCNSDLCYTGAGTRGIDCRSGQSIIFEGLALTYNNASFTGTLIDYSWSNYPDASNDSTNCQIINCLVGCPMYLVARTPLFSATKLVSLNEAIFFTTERSTYRGGQVGIKGSDHGGYSNGHRIINCEFDNLEVAAVMNMQQQCSIHNCTFEGTTATGGDGLGYLYYHNAETGGGNHMLSIIGSWYGDTDQEVAIKSTTYNLSLQMFGNAILNGAIAIEAPGCSGVLVGNSMDQVDVGGATSSAGLVMIGSGDLLGGYLNPHSLVIGRGFNSNSGYKGPEQMQLGGARIVTSRGENRGWRLWITGTPTEGTFKLLYGRSWYGTHGELTGTIAYNASAATIQSALEALPSLAPGDVTVTGGPLPASTYIYYDKWEGIPDYEPHIRESTVVGGTVSEERYDDPLEVTAVAQAALGVGGAASVLQNSNDVVGVGALTVGSSPSAGLLAEFWYTRTFYDSLTDSEKPKVLVSPRTAAAAAANLYAAEPPADPAAEKWQKFDLYCANGPTEGQDLSFNYWVAQ